MGEGSSRPPSKRVIRSYAHTLPTPTSKKRMSSFASAPTLRAERRIRGTKVAAVPATKELKQLSDAEIEERVARAKRRLFDLRIKKATRQEFKPHEFAENKKEVSRLLTIRRQREIEEGVSKRESRKMKKKAMLDMSRLSLYAPLPVEEKTEESS